MFKATAHFILAILLLVCVACGDSDTSGTTEVELRNDVPVIQVDDAHLQMRGFGEGDALSYSVAATDKLLLDATDYVFEFPPNSGITAPNMIQLALRQYEIYGMDWRSDTSVYTLTAESLIPLGGAVPFKGLKAGDKAIIAIGYSDPNAANKIAEFKVLWVGIIEVH